MKAHRLFALILLLACSRQIPTPRAFQVRVVPPLPNTRAAAADEDRISDCNILIYNCFGILEEQRYFPWREMEESGLVSFETRLLKNAPLTILAAANLGYKLSAPLHLSKAETLRHHLTYPDEYSQGLPMVARLDGCLPDQKEPVTLQLERLMARIDLQIDRSALDADVSFRVRSVLLGGCPSSALLFTPSRAETGIDVFTEGFRCDGPQADVLNRDESLGLSQPLSLYQLENCQGDLLEGVESDADKVFIEGRYREVCSYLEIRAEYLSESWATQPGKYLIYRCYLGESLANFDVRRNACYPITVRPQGDGLGGDGWRVDKEGLEPRRSFALHPAAYNECQKGEDFHLWCEVLPKGTPMTIEPIAYDEDIRVAQLYDYTLDEDGNGLTIHTKKGGTAVIYFNAGPPVNRDTLAMLVIAP